MITQVDLRSVEKDLKRVPKPILIKLRRWVGDVESVGLEEVRKVRAWNDHTLHGDRKGQRAIYLNLQWRAVYVLVGDRLKIVKVIEVHPHAY
jgi:hypothetical protein